MLVGLAVLVGLAGLVTACGGGNSDRGRSGEKVRVVAAFFPLAEAVRNVGGGRVTVTDLTPAGAEPHDLELTTEQVDAIQDARLVVVLGGGFQPAIEKAARQRDGTTLTVLARAGAHGSDPHVWLDPVRMAGIVTDVGQTLAEVDPAGRAVYEQHSAAYRARLVQLDVRYRAGLARCARRTIVTGHAAFGYLARRYGVRQEGVAGISPDAEPDPRRLAELADLVRREHVTTVFTEALVSPKVAEALAREAGGVRTEVLDPLEGLTEEERAAGDDYVRVMEVNLARLERALGCSV